MVVEEVMQTVEEMPMETCTIRDLKFCMDRKGLHIARHCLVVFISTCFAQPTSKPMSIEIQTVYIVCLSYPSLVLPCDVN